ncbi:hypothetical protein GCM10009800_31000 [Nocardiopsis rhodophaea]
MWTQLFKYSKFDLTALPDRFELAPCGYTTKHGSDDSLQATRIRHLWECFVEVFSDIDERHPRGYGILILGKPNPATIGLRRAYETSVPKEGTHEHIPVRENLPR